ncbi:tetratricopeptide repeat protein [Aequorivita viscosa]|nr:tetratricopeptide repeat protein [Aequorivita viscosa]
MFFERKAYYFAIGLLCFVSSIVFAQDQKKADSLLIIYQEDNLKGLEKLKLLEALSFNEIHNLDAAIGYAEELINLAKQEGDYLYLYRGYMHKGNSHRLAGDLNAALNAFFKSTQASIKANYLEGEGSTYTAIADTYSEIGNSKNAEIYYAKAIQILRQTNDSIALATTLLNAGDEYFNSEKYALALQYFEESGLIFKKANYKIGTAYNLGNVGMVYAEQGKDSLAKTYINDAIAVLEELEDYYAISEYLTYMSDIYMKQKNSATALTYAQRSYNLALKYGLKKQISESSLKLSELYEQHKNIPASYALYKKHIAYRDSVTNLEGVAKMADLRTAYEVSRKQVEVDLLNQQKRKSTYHYWIYLFIIAHLIL